VAKGLVRLRSNVVDAGNAWHLVPGELAARYRPDLFRRENRPRALQVEEKMYYVPCGVCERPTHLFMREGCDRCSHGPRPRQLQEAQERHRRALEAVEAARRELEVEKEAVAARHAEAAATPGPEPEAERIPKTPAEPAVPEAVDDHQACIVPGCARVGRNKLGVRCRVWHDGPYLHGKGKTAALWAPDADAFLCDEHALQGAKMTLLYEPDSSRTTTIRVVAALHGEERVRRIRSSM
jgi:hypothetical protein